MSRTLQHLLLVAAMTSAPLVATASPEPRPRPATTAATPAPATSRPSIFQRWLDRARTSTTLAPARTTATAPSSTTPAAPVELRRWLRRFFASATDGAPTDRVVRDSPGAPPPRTP